MNSGKVKQTAGRNRMRRRLLTLLALFFPSAPYAGNSLSLHDAAVLSACIDIVAPTLSHTDFSTGAGETLFISALNKPHWQYIEEQAAAEFGVSTSASDSEFPFPSRPYTSRIQVRGNMDGPGTSTLETLFTSLRERTSAGWKLPLEIRSSYHRIVYRDAEESVEGNTSRISFSFWPPGYSIPAQTALVRAFVTPSEHGATATCLLRHQHERWHVVNHWLFFYR